ncbi:MAG TPA: hypothetical protein VF669_14655, partial [Tepidisphaeraceae bacterium]
MIYVNVPIGGDYGWGMVGKYFTRELAALAPIRLVTPDFTAKDVGEEFEHYRLNQLRATAEELVDLPKSPLLQGIVGSSLLPTEPQYASTKTIGYTALEENHLRPQAIETAKQRYQTVVTPSAWCTQILRDHGLENVTTILQGVDPSLFFPHEVENRILPDKFVVFSGGKFEFRKGQDVVIRAFKVLADRHPDVMLLTAWYNHWPSSWQSMKISPLIHFAPSTTRYFDALNETLAANGIDPARAIHLAPRP